MDVGVCVNVVCIILALQREEVLGGSKRQTSVVCVDKHSTNTHYLDTHIHAHTLTNSHVISADAAHPTLAGYWARRCVHTHMRTHTHVRMHAQIHTLLLIHMSSLLMQPTQH